MSIDFKIVGDTKIVGTVSYGPFPVLLHGTTEEQFREQFETIMKEKFAPKLNKMQEWLYGDQLRALPREELKRVLEKRCGSGNTTGQALSQIAEAIKNPNQPVKLVHDHGANASTFQQREYRDYVKSLIDKLGLKFMVFHQHNKTLTFEI